MLPARRPLLSALLLLPALATALLLPNLIGGLGYTDSTQYNVVWTSQFATSIAAGDPWPRWLPQSFTGLGSPTFYFYPPLAFMLSGALAAAGLAPDTAISLAAVLFLAASGLAMLAWLRFAGARHPLAGAALFTAAPYHLADFHSRGAFAEFAGFVWLPLIALGIAAAGQRRWAAPLLATALAGLILTHLPSALLACVFLIAPFGLFTASRRRTALIPITLGTVTGLALAAAYLGPALVLQPHVAMALMRQPFFDPANWSVWSSHPPITPNDLLWFARLTIPPAAAAAAALAFARRSVSAAPIRIWALLALAAAALSASLLPAVWTLPLLDRVQFPWRLLPIAEFAAITALCLTPLPRWLAAAIAALFAMLSLLMLQDGVTAVQTLGANPAARADWLRSFEDAPEYLPRGIAVPEVDNLRRGIDLTRFAGPAITGGTARPAPDGRLTITVTTPGPVTIRRFSFPIWQVTRNGTPVITTPSPANQWISFRATPGTYTLSRRTLAIEQWSAAISLAGLVLLLLLFRLRPHPN